MSSTNPTKFIREALFFTASNPLALSYSDTDQKWIIWRHLISLIQDFPSLKPSVDVFTHDDGTEAKLLAATGDLPVSHHAPPVPVTIWVHELYPQMAPIVYVDLARCKFPVYENHSLVDSSGATVSSYLRNWEASRCDLSELAHNLSTVFSHNHPFNYSDSDTHTHPSVLSKTEAIDRLADTIQYDILTNRSETEEEIENLLAIQCELNQRSEAVKKLLRCLEEEHIILKQRIRGLRKRSDVLFLPWLKSHGNGPALDNDEPFQCLGAISESEVECLASDFALEDLIFQLDRAVEEGAVELQVYMKQVRVLSRKQFFLRAEMLALTSHSNQPDTILDKLM